MRVTWRCCRTLIDTNEQPGSLAVFARWLTASPANAVLVLGATLLSSFLSVVGATVLSFLVAAQGPRLSALLATGAAVTVALFAGLIGLTVQQVVETVVLAWLPAAILMGLWRATGSTRLAQQLSVLLAIAGMLVFYAAIDVNTFWTTYVENLNALYREAGVVSPFVSFQADLQKAGLTIADLMTPAAFAGLWIMALLGLMLGGGLYNRLAAAERKFGRLRDLDFGRVIAVIFGVALLLALLTNWSIVWQISVLFMAVFAFQGLALLHWIHLEQHGPAWMLFLAYGLMLVLAQYMVTIFAVIGFFDAALGARRRFEKSKV